MYLCNELLFESVKRYFLYILACLSPVVGYSQNLNFVNFGINEGLPSTEVHDIYEDRNGFIWFATDRGIARYDGNDFLVFDEDDGLENIVTFNFYEEQPNKVWISNLRNELLCTDLAKFPLKFTRYKHNSELINGFHELRWNCYIRQFWSDKDGNLYFSFLVLPGVLKVSPTGEYSILASVHDMLAIEYQKIHRFNDVLVHVSFDSIHPYVYSEFIMDEADPHDVIVVNDATQEKIVAQEKLQDIGRAFRGIADICYTQKGVRFLCGNVLVVYENEQVKSVDLGVNGLRIRIIDDKMYVCTTAGVKIFNKELQQIGHLLVEQRCTDLYQDRCGGIWVSTSEAGVYYCANPNILVFGNPSEQEMIFDLIEKNDKYLIAGTWDDNLWVYETGKPDPIISEQVTTWSGVISSINERNEVEFDWVFGKPLSTPFTSKYSIGKLYRGLKWKEEENIFSTKTAIYVFEDTDAEFFKYKNCPKIYDQVRVGEDSLYLVTEEGLYRSDLKGNAEPIENGNDILRTKMNQIEQFQGGYLMASYTAGLVYYKEGKSFSFGKNKGLSSSSITCLEVQNDSSIWIGTNLGLNHFEILYGQGLIQVNHINTAKGLPSNEVLATELYRDTIWVGTKGGLVYFNTKNFTHNSLIRSDLFVMDSLRINKEKYYGNPQMIECEEYDEIDIHFSQIIYAATADVKYQYRIIEEDPGWTYLDGGYVRIANLSNGEFHLQISATYENIRGPIKTIVLNVALPWWKSWWAIVIYILLGIGLLALIFKLLLNRVDNRRKKELEKVQLELKALISQMNPHFTFNTINSIQHYIIENESRMAMDYLAEFALLMRQSLDFSRREYITLQEEVSFLKLYVDLESRRFGKPIDFEITLKTVHTPDIIAFPALLLQPIIENAIVHGLQGIDYPAEIHLSITEKGKYFEIEVADNGVGLNGPRSGKSKNHKSHGLEILKSRIKLYNTVQGESSDLQITDNETAGRGTLVKIKLYKANTINI